MENKVAENRPQKLGDLTQDFMYAYIKGQKQEEIEWFKKLCNDNIIEKPNNLDKTKTIKTIDLKKVRRSFADRYFPEIRSNKKKAKSFLDMVNEL